MLGEGLLLDRVVLSLFALFLAVGGVRLLHGKEGGAELLVVHGAQVFELGGKLCEILMLECVLSGYSLVGVIGQQLVEDVSHVLRAPARQKLLYPHPLLYREIYFHVRRLALEAVQHLLPRGPEDVVDSVDLVQLVLAREERLFGDEFEEHAAEAPDVHFLIIVAVGHEALRGPVPAGGDVVGVGEGGVLALARAEVGELDEVALEEYVFGLYVAVEDALPVHELYGPEHLEHVELYFLEGEGALLVFEALVHVHVHQLKNQRQLPYFTPSVPLGSSYRA